MECRACNQPVQTQSREARHIFDVSSPAVGSTRTRHRFQLGLFIFSFLTSLISSFPFGLPYVEAYPFGGQSSDDNESRGAKFSKLRPECGPRATSKITGRGGCAKYCGTAPSPGNISFSSFRQSFTSNVNYLKRRFSSGDLSSELDDEPSTDSGLASVARDSSQPYQAVPDRPLQSQPAPVPPANQPPVPGAPPPGPPQPVGGDLSLNLRPGSRTTSAPSSPAKTRESLLQRVQSLTGAARDQGASILGAAVSGATRGPSYSKDRCFTLLVIDDQNTDWSKYFRGRRLHGDYEIRVEQAEFRELSLTANEAGTIVSMAVYRNGTKVIRSFKPDFVLIRQNLRDAGEDNKNLLLGMMYGGIPSVNNLTAIYNFQDKPWVFAHLLGLQRRLGKDNFPLIEQTFYPNHREMVSRHSRMPYDLRVILYFSKLYDTYKSYQIDEVHQGPIPSLHSFEMQANPRYIKCLVFCTKFRPTC
ncbi:hypothetical protein KM043_012647 [Ampulex compressa]|nr:hypothetical protein KM043_012647 [Ampulex compressa]